MGYVYHMKKCGKEASELEKLLLNCKHCGKAYRSRAGLEYHVKNEHSPVSPVLHYSISIYLNVTDSHSGCWSQLSVVADNPRKWSRRGEDTERAHPRADAERTGQALVGAGGCVPPEGDRQWGAAEGMAQKKSAAWPGTRRQEGAAKHVYVKLCQHVIIAGLWRSQNLCEALFGKVASPLFVLHTFMDSLKGFSFTFCELWMKSQSCMNCIN